MIYINMPRPDKIPDKTIIYLSDNGLDVIVKTPEMDMLKLKNQVEQFIKIELEKAKKQQQKYNTIVDALTEMIGG